MNSEILTKFFKDGKLANYPSKNIDREEVWNIMKTWFDTSKHYNEMQVNMIIKMKINCMDHAFFRRELVDHGILKRDKDGKEYWVE